MPDLYPVTVGDMIAEVRRELEMRRNVYARAAREGRMNRHQADRRIEIMAAVLARLEQQQRKGAR
jgi:hypothetical protein